MEADVFDQQLITRRRSLALLGSTGAGLLAAGATSRIVSPASAAPAATIAKACVLTPEQEVGPFYVAYDRVREDIVGGATGLPLELHITIISSLTCKPIKGAAVDIWQCDALGVYSDESSENTVGETYLRGVQFTDSNGLVTFKTVYPGHYAGRTTHIHAKVHIASGDYHGSLVGGHVSHIGQMFPPDAVNTEVYRVAPYTHDTIAIVTHAEDRVWTQQHGPDSQLRITRVGNRLSGGLIASVTLAANPRIVPAAVGGGGGAPPA
jgi:protocatechuate 3,4-dioxygenase beta subunit